MAHGDMSELAAIVSIQQYNYPLEGGSLDADVLVARAVAELAALYLPLAVRIGRQARVPATEIVPATARAVAHAARKYPTEDAPPFGPFLTWFIRTELRGGGPRAVR